MDLLGIVIEHDQCCLEALRKEESLLANKTELTAEEESVLEMFIQNKTCHFAALKAKKMLRDGVDLSLLSTESEPSPSSSGNDTLEPATPDNVVNLSSITLSEDELSALSKGLSFCPSSGKCNELLLYKDLENFARSLRLKEYYHDSPKDDNMGPRLPSVTHWTPPPQRDKCMDMYIKAVQRDIIAEYRKRSSYRPNLSGKEQRALEILSTRTDVIIKPADKGGAIVVMNQTDYNTEAQRQLSDTSFYQPLPADPTLEYKERVRSTIIELQDDKTIDKNTARALIPLHCTPGRFYLLPKIHKLNNPGRPIVSGIGTVTEKISSYVDNIIREIPPTFPSYIKDTTHFLNEITDLTLPDNSLLVTLDVASLYTNIPHAGGIESVISAYENSDCDKPVDSNTLSKLLRLILELNNFEFNDQHYVQVSGTSMGTKIGPNYANIFMGTLETKFLDNYPLKPLFYKRYIDDIFLVWSHGEENLNKFISDFNKAHCNISFSHAYSASTISFLDVQITTDNNGLATSVYRKPTDRHQYLNFHSSHVRHCKTAIPYSQALRFRRICSNQNDFASNCEQLRIDLARQKYPLPLIENSIRKASEQERSSLISDSKAPNSRSRTNLILTYSASGPNVNEILRRHHNILLQSERMRHVIPDPPRVVYRRARNIRDMVTSSQPKKVSFNGSAPCGKPRCKLCLMMKPTTSAQSRASRFSMQIRGNFDCDTANIVYLLECGTCGAQYVGQTENPFRTRINGHRSDAKMKPNLPLSKHISSRKHPFDQFTATVLQSGFRTQFDREACESYLIHKFNTLSSGINESPGRLSCLQA